MEYENRTHVALPPAALFAYLGDDAHRLEWRDGLVAFERLDDAADATARRYAETVETPLGRQVMTVALNADPASYRVTFDVLDGPVRPQGAMTLEPADDGSTLSYHLTYTPRLAVATPLDRIVFDALVATVDRTLERLQRVLAAAPEHGPKAERSLEPS